MIHAAARSAVPSTDDRCSNVVCGHRAFLGLSIANNALSAFTMYTVQLDQLGSFISDSRQEAFRMAFEALSLARSERAVCHGAQVTR